jgi:hypothetical protein
MTIRVFASLATQPMQEATVRARIHLPSLSPRCGLTDRPVLIVR